MNSLLLRQKILFSKRGIQSRRIHPLLWGAALLVKKSVVYKAASVYGYPRIYRRLREQTKIHVADPLTRQHVNNLVKHAIRAPTQAYLTFEDTEVHKTLTKILAAGGTQAQASLPPFMYTLLTTAAEGLLPMKAVRNVQAAAKKKSRQDVTSTGKTKRLFSSSSSSTTSTSMFLRTEIQILLGLACGTLVGVYAYSKYADDGIHDVSAAKERHTLAERAVAAKHKGDHRLSIQLYEELLMEQRTLASNRAKHGHVAPGSSPGDPIKFDSVCQILAELGWLHHATKEYDVSIQFYEEVAAVAKERRLAKEYGSLCDRLGQVHQDSKAYGRSEQMYVEALRTFVPPDVAVSVFAPDGKPRKELSLNLAAFKQWWLEPVDPKFIMVENSERFTMAAGVLYNLSSMYCEIGKLEQAESVLKRCFVAAKMCGHTSVEQEEKMVLLLDGLMEAESLK